MTNNIKGYIPGNGIQLQDLIQFQEKLLTGRLCGFNAYDIFKKEDIPPNEVLFRVELNDTTN